MISCKTANLVSMLGKKWMPHIISTFSEQETLSFGDCKRAFPYMTDRVISLRLKELVMLEMLEVCDDRKYTATQRMKKVDVVLKELEKIENSL